MSLFKRNNVLRNIKSKQDFISTISKGDKINYIGTNEYDGIGFIKDMVMEYIHNDFKCKMLILTGLTSVQMVFKINIILKDYEYEVIDKGTLLMITFKNIPHRIYIQHYPSYGIDMTLFEHDFRIILHLTYFKALDSGLLPKIYNTPNKSNLSIVAAYRSNEDISLKSFLKLRKYINNLGFIMYDEEIGDTCFIDIINRKHVVKVIREKGTTT